MRGQQLVLKKGMRITRHGPLAAAGGRGFKVTFVLGGVTGKNYGFHFFSVTLTKKVESEVSEPER